jgi:hypothetical protein
VSGSVLDAAQPAAVDPPPPAAAAPVLEVRDLSVLYASRGASRRVV